VLEQTAHPQTCLTGRVVNERMEGGFEPARQRAVQVQDERGDVGPRGGSVVMAQVSSRYVTSVAVDSQTPKNLWSFAENYGE
jgi:hypothetical protein